MKTVLLCLDGYKEEYLRYSQFLRRFYEENTHGLVRPTFGYSATTSALTGEQPNKHGILATFNFSEKGLRYFSALKFLDRVPGKKITRLFAIVGYNLFRQIPSHRKLVSLYNIPFEYARHLDFTQHYPLLNLQSLKVPTLISRLHKRNVGMAGYMWPFIMQNGTTQIDFRNLSTDTIGTDERALRVMLKLLDKPFSFYLFQLYESDLIGHKYGTTSSKIKEVVVRYDHYVEKVSKKCDNLIIFSDHGMVDITGTVDIWDWINGSGLKYGKDYLMFLDSTLARFMVLSEKGRKIEKYLKNLKHGHLLSQEEFQKWDIPRNYGDLIWLVDSGQLICPNFFSAVPAKGMHSYSPDVPENMGIYAFNQLKKRKNIDITEISKITLGLVQ